MSAHSCSVGIAVGEPTGPGLPGPPWSTMVPLAARSSSPGPPSVMLNTTVFPVIVEGITYQLPDGMPCVGPYFQYCAPAGSVAG